MGAQFNFDLYDGGYYALFSGLGQILQEHILEPLVTRVTCNSTCNDSQVPYRSFISVRFPARSL